MLPASVRAISRCLVGLRTAGYFRSDRVTSKRRTVTLVTMATGGETIMVTGGAGFLGQHIVKLLQERGDNLKEIRVFDKKPYVNNLGHAEDIPMWSIVGDLCNPDEVTTAFRGVNSVYHVAGLVSFGTFPDLRGMENVNVNGTQNVIEACLKQHVSRLVFCSTVDVVIGFDEIHDGNETTTTKPDTFLFPGYPDTKYRAELKVLEANGKQHSDGKRLQSLSLRPNVMYGEGDPYFVVNPLMTAKKSGGKLYRVGNGEALFQQAYAGNVAWAFIMADRALKTSPERVGGQTFFVPDDTPTQSVFEFLEPFLCARGYRLSSFRIPYWFLYGLLYITETLLWIISPLIKINMKTPLCSIMYTNMTLYFNRSKAETLLGYKPIFTPEESMERSLKYYKDAEL